MIKKTIKLLLIALIAFSVLPEGVWAETIEKTLKTDVIVSFGTDKSYDNGGQDVSLRLVYKAWLKSDPTIEITESIIFNHLDVINGTSKPLLIKVVGPDKVVYTGEFKFTYSYDSKTGSLKVNNKDTALNSKALVTALAYPEAWIKPGVVGIEMNPLPFSYVKAISSPNVNYVKEFNDRINGGITNLITLESSRYGTNLQTNTKLAIYINQWQRKPDGTYDKSKEAKTVQVIFTAADFLNGRASGNGWDGVQYFRQMKDITTTLVKDIIKTVSVFSGNYRTEYNVQDFLREDTVWGHAGTDGAWSPIYVGTCTPTSTKRCQTWREFISYRMRCSSTSGASQDYWHPYNMSVHQSVGDSFCRSKSTTFTRFHSLQETKKVWSTASSLTNYAFNRRGYKIQNSWKVKVYGPAYWTDMVPDATQNYLGSRKSPIMRNVNLDFVNFSLNGNVISKADMLLESDVNNRVLAYASGVMADMVVRGNAGIIEMDKKDYTLITSSLSSPALTTANNTFKEGNYWGLYLYQTGHWRAVEVPVQWYSIGGMLENQVTLTGTELKPDPEIETEPKDTSISLIDFTYVQAVYNSLRASYPVAAAQTMLVEAIKTDKNIAAQKAYQYYAGLLEKGETHLGALKTMSRALNIDLFK